ncbi:MAG TPA: hypothetical protein DIW30_08580 [Bacteroidales bacterium]|nr:hypothetical protein [Bacteroidales bacterium]
MKKTLLFSLCLICASIAETQAEVIKLDLNKPTNPTSIAYNQNDIWSETYNESESFRQLEFQVFRFSHLPSGESYAGTSWEGFTVSKVSSDSVSYNGCMSKGGLQGEGTPFVLAYYSEFYGEKSNVVTFTGETAYRPLSVSICQNTMAYKDITKGDYTGYTFKEGDYFALHIYALDKNLQKDESKEVTYYLADYRSPKQEERTLNKGWEDVDLKALGDCYGLCFTMTSTGKGQWGTNTSTFFALDGLQVESTGSAVSNIDSDTEAEWIIYSIDGRQIGIIHSTLAEVRNQLPYSGTYIVRSGNYCTKIVK